ncbi:MAG: transposase [Blautia wexlerae]
MFQTAPGTSTNFTAIGIIFEIGINMEAFHSAKHLCSSAGLAPTNNESIEKKSVWVSRNGCYIKPLLLQWPTLLLPAKSILRFLTVISVLKSVAVTGKQSLL